MKSKIIILLCILSGYSIQAQVFEKSAQKRMAYKTGSDCTVSITNKYGSIQIIPSETDSVIFFVEIKVFNKKESDAIKKLNSVDIKFSGNPFLISATTYFTDAGSQLQTEISDVTKALFNPTNRVEINYFVNIPQNCNIKIDNKYGNFFMSDHSANVDLSILNGDVKAGNISGDLSTNFVFVKANITSAKSLKADLSYSELTLRNAESIKITSKSSKVSLQSVQKADVDSKNDKYTIDTLSNINAKSNFSNIQISKLNEGALIRSMYGDIAIHEIGINSKFININADYTDITLTFPKEISATFFADYRKTKITYTPDLGVFETKVTNPDSMQTTLSGIIGSGQNPGFSVQIFAVSGNLMMIRR